MQVKLSEGWRAESAYPVYAYGVSISPRQCMEDELKWVTVRDER